MLGDGPCIGGSIRINAEQNVNSEHLWIMQQMVTHFYVTYLYILMIVLQRILV